MKLAIVTLPTSDAGRAAESARELVGPLRELCAVELFVEDGREGGASGGEATRAVSTLRAQDFDHIVYDVDDDARHAFMAPFVRELGGTVVLRSWSLVNLAFARHPELARGGWRGQWTALREGGLRQALNHARCMRAGNDALERSRACGDLALNRSIVRYGDAFFVHEPELVEKILVERNAATPIAVVAVPVARSAAGEDSSSPTSPRVQLDEPQGEGAWAHVANAWIRHLETFPQPRSKRRSLVQSMVEAADRNRGR